MNIRQPRPGAVALALAIPQELPAFMQELRGRDAITARALELLILRAAPTSEVLLADRAEIGGDVWTLPQDRTKSGRQHVVPLVPRGSIS